MELSYWESRWQKDTIGFHMAAVNPRLPQFQDKWNTLPPGKVLVPLCGKTHDLIWFERLGWEVHGNEAIAKACTDFHQEHHRTAVIHERSPFKLYSSGNIHYWLGNWFKLSPKHTGTIQLIYDRAAFVAMPPEKRLDYVAKLRQFMQPDTQLLLHTFEYNQADMSGPPFSIPEEEVHQYFGIDFEVEKWLHEDMTAHLERFKQRGIRKIDELFFSIRLKA